MEFSIATLLAQFSDDKLVAGKSLEKKLECEQPEDFDRLAIALDALEKSGILVKERGKYRRVLQDDVVEAKLRCSSKGFCFAIQDVEDADDIYIKESQLSNAWNGDRVLVKIIKDGTRRRSPEGAVQLILERSNPSLLAKVVKQQDNFCAIPLDDRLLFELNLQEEREKLEAVIEHLVHVSVVRYPLADHGPLGKVTKVLGSDAEEAADTDIVCCKHDLPQVFAPEVEALGNKLRKKLPVAEVRRRLDLREHLTFTIESDRPQEAPNPFIENAFSLEKTEEGHWDLMVHITDVAQYIDANSPLDKAARKRATAIYLGDKFLPLFPDGVTKQCSLVAGEEHLAISYILTLDPQGKMVNFQLRESVIQVDQALTYTQVQQLLSEPEDQPADQGVLVEKLTQLFFHLCPLVKAHRLQRGSFQISLDDEVSVYKDEGRLGAMVFNPQYPIATLLSEFMILANQQVADQLLAWEVPGMFVAQPHPDFEELEDLIKLSHNLGLEFELESEEEIFSHDYQNFVQEFNKSEMNKVLNFLLKNTLKSTKYSSHPAPHFGLAYGEAYTHCIAPGQRYGDFFLQRLIKTVLTKGRDRRNARSKQGVDLGSSSCRGEITWNVLPPQQQTEFSEAVMPLIHHLNEREKIIGDAENDLQGLKKAEKMKERTGQVFQGLITGVQSYGFFVEIEDLLVEGLVHVSSLKDDWYEYRSRHSCLVGRKNRVAYRLGDQVEVEIKSVDYYRQQIDLATVRGGSNANDSDWEE